MTEKEKIRNEVFELQAKINEWDNAYYNLDAPLVEDAIYDREILKLKKLEEQYSSYFSFEELANSPTQKINAKSSDLFKKVTHDSPMLSLNKAYTEEEIQKFIDNIKKVTPTFSFFLEPKIDGLSISIKYRNGQLFQAVTRGDGLVGEDVTENIKQIKNIPKEIAYQKPLEVRGEVYLALSEFEKINLNFQKENKPLMANPRNAAAGTLRQLDKEIVANRNLSAFLYNIVAPEDHNIFTILEARDFLKNLGFSVTKEATYAKDLSEINSYIENFKHLKKTLDYETDGVVIKLNELQHYDALGATNKFPHSAIAFKYEPNTTTTVLKNIFITVGRTGLVTYNAELEPVILSGSCITFATLNNYQYIKDLKLNKGDLVYIKKAGEIIPCVIGLVNKKHEETEFNKFLKCPYCNSDLIETDTLLEQYCSNENCPEIRRKKIIHFASKKAMELNSLGEKNIDVFINEGLLENVIDFYKLKEKKDKIMSLERFGTKSVMNILKSIEESKKNSLDRVIFGLSIKHIGSKVAYFLASKILKLSNFLDFDFDSLISYNEIGEKIISSLKNWVAKEENKNLVKDLLDNDVDLEFIATKKTERFAQLSFVITGTLSQPRSHFEKLIKENGGSISSAVSAKTSYLLVGEDAGSKLAKARALNVKILDEEAFNELLVS
ncbi:NAD(+)-dependent DNA ligase [Metamycoplasma arthritidis]|uniref:DNA ligase n=1 Tax=Metamycoplasma arthritidis (strain 158L3-1) TaxID=243272 RepID=DNLJ_META1|nr:NAD-dependent DNA ligase LigA [Metamycoplasma arthritidis]B3PMJ0.1 RecName: Full=DNA ligase; AltName: Full=Polydeoxyribonucleotide synthase [NAD(+)] [Metamycoplasma arthritidis 158L3-1]ACF07242.1 DNA ligase [Metamycoplasma arthritidis 158L3-1]VEU78766.1 NAD(+)-dependent DNA ligase [Metamycoplasma arthritidis]